MILLLSINRFLVNVALNFLLFFFFQPLCTKNIEKPNFDQCLEYTAPKHWSKYTTSEDVKIKPIFFISGNCLDTVIDGSFMGIVLVSTIKQGQSKGGGGYPKRKIIGS